MVSLGRQVRVAVVGGGAAGIATAVKLAQAGFREFDVFEMSDGPGGTWHDNDYPGCEVDIHSYFYSYSFMPWVWSRTHGGHDEIRRYLEATIERFGVGGHFRYNTKVSAARWDEHRSQYEVELDDGSTSFYDLVITCVGFLNNPRYPEWPGLDEFPGTVFHTSRWRHDLDMSQLTVGFVGTGSTASQAVPSLAGMVKQLYVFQREPGWVVPKGDFDYSPEQIARFEHFPVLRKLERYKQYRRAGKNVKGMWREGTKLNRKFRQIALDHINQTIKDPEVRAAVTPPFPFGCKRTIQSSTYYPAFNEPNVKLVPHAVESANRSGLVADGQQYNMDVIVLGTGFQAQNYVGTMEVVGKAGVSLSDEWGGDPRAFCGLTVPGFPNFVTVYGPNTNGGGSGIYQIERGADVAVRMAKRLRRGAAAVDTRRWAYDRYTKWVDHMCETKLTAQIHCHNYYFSESGRNVTQWPASHQTYRIVTTILPLVGLRARSFASVPPRQIDDSQALEGTAVNGSGARPSSWTMRDRGKLLVPTD